MKAITLWQPWASLLAKGPKKHETRSWKTSYRGWVAIHAALKFDRIVTDACQMFERELAEIGYPKPWDVPLGAVVGVGNLSDMIYCGETLRSASLIPDLHEVLPYGDYSPGRFAWIFSEMIPIEPPIAAVGKQGIWNWDTLGQLQLLIGQLDNL